MASFIYDKAYASFMNGGMNLTSATVKVALVQITGSGTPYTANSATDQYLSDIPSGAIAASTPALTSKVTAAGIFGAANTAFSSVPSGPACGALVLYIDTGTPSTSQLIADLDSSKYSSLPVTPTRANINLSFPSSGNLIFAL